MFPGGVPDILWEDEEELYHKADELRKLNPGVKFVVEDGVVWLREDGIDHAIYAKDDGKVVCVVAGRNPRKRKVRE